VLTTLAWGTRSLVRLRLTVICIIAIGGTIPFLVLVIFLVIILILYHVVKISI
jgi:hypothetical protein